MNKKEKERLKEILREYIIAYQCEHQPKNYTLYKTATHLLYKLSH